MRYYLLLITVLLESLFPQSGHTGGPVPTGNCSRYENFYLIAEKRIGTTPLSPPSILFADPMSGNGMNSYQRTVTNYVDLNNNTSEVKDYSCGTITYDGHAGTDIEILNFYQMDEGVPVLAAAPGIVVAKHDGEFDRNTQWVNGLVANGLCIRYGDNLYVFYLHFRKNSLCVNIGDSIRTGDTLGMVGSSGYSSGPHLHFEVQTSTSIIDPFTGNCNTATSLWLQQKDYVLNYPFEKMDDGLTTLPLNWAALSERPPTKTHVSAGKTVYSWIRARNILATDTLRWQYYRNGSYWNSYQFSPGTTYASSWWCVYWTLPTTAGDFGNWTIKIFRNSTQIAEQNFLYDNDQNILPHINDTLYTVAKNGSLKGEWKGYDPDGSIFWYRVSRAPALGALESSGGRNRRFTYTPPLNFTGRDTVFVYAVDDENASGSAARIVFDIQPLGLENNTLTANTISLSQNYPNPFNPTTTISYRIPKSGFVSLVVYDVLGREVKTLANEEKPAGRYSVEFNANNLSSGVYFYTLRSGDFLATKKLLLVK